MFCQNNFVFEKKIMTGQLFPFVLTCNHIFSVSCRTQETSKTQCVSIKASGKPGSFNHSILCHGFEDRLEIAGHSIIEERGAGLMHYVPLVWSERSVTTGPRGISQRTFSTRHSEEASSADQGSTFWPSRLILISWCQFHQHFTSSFCAWRSQK